MGKATSKATSKGAKASKAPKPLKAPVDPKKPPGRSRKPSAKKVQNDLDDEPSEPPIKKKQAKSISKDTPAGENDEDDGSVSVEWDKDLTWQLVNAIEEDKDIREKLFPPIGSHPSTQEGGGKPKTDFQYALAEAVFAEHPLYATAFAGAQSPNDRKAWALKIKNRLRAITNTVRQHRSEMGETGAGITQEEEIDMTLNNTFTNKWALIKTTCPWYWRMNAIISDRPNLVPAGIGNNNTGYNIALLMGSGLQGKTVADGVAKEVESGVMVIDELGAIDERDFRVADDGEVEQEIDELVSSGEESDDELPESILDSVAKDGVVTPDKPAPEGDSNCKSKRKGEALESMTTKRTMVDVKPSTKRTGARTATSTPAPPSNSVPRKSAKNALDKFNDAAAREDETARKVLELKSKRTEVSASITIAKIQAKAEIKKAKELTRAKLLEKKQEQEHQFRLAQLRLQAQISMRQGSFGNTTSGLAGGSWFGGIGSELGGASSPLTFGSVSGSSSPFNFDAPLPLEDDLFKGDQQNFNDM